MIARQHSVCRRAFAAVMLAMFFVAALVHMVKVLPALAVSPPNILTYQGRLLNANGVPVSDASAEVIFQLYTASSGGSCLWSNSSATCASSTARTVTLTDGLFSENLGDTAAAIPYAAIGDSIFASDDADGLIYLAVTINGEALSPRKLIAAAPFALNADTVDGYNTTLAGGTSALVPVLDTNGNLQLTGNPSGSGISNGSVYINPAVVDAAANDIVFGVARGGTALFSVDSEGDTSVTGGLAVTGGSISSTSAMALISTGGDISLGPNGSGVVTVTAGDDFAVGSSTIVAPFSVDESTNTVRIGDAISDANDPSLTFYASDGADSGTLSYADDDRFTFTGGNLTFNGLGTVPTIASSVTTDLSALSTFTGTSGGSLSNVEMYGGRIATTYSAVEGSSTDHVVGAEEHYLTITGASATLTNAFATRSFLQNDSTNASLVQGAGYMAGLEGEFMQNATGTTVGSGYGVHGLAYSKAGTITAASGVVGEVTSNTGTVTTAYGGRFLAKAAGATRYAVYGEASGGATANYAGYFAGSLVQIDDDGTPNAAGLSTGAGDLYVLNELEADGSASFGDTTGTDLFDFASGATTQDVVEMSFNTLTGGTGLALSRAAGGADFDGKLLTVSQLNSSLTTDANAFLLTNNGGGNSVGMYIVQNTLSAHVANSTGNNAFIIDVNEASGNENMAIFRSDADGSPDTEFRVESDGDLYADGAAYNAGADYAEFFYTTDAGLSDYEVVCQDETTAEAVKTCEAGNTQVMGVISTNPAFVGNNFVGASGDLSSDPRYRKVGMVGQIETLVNAGEGAIAIGDPLTASAVLSGYAAKAEGPVRIVGFALESLASGTGTLRVLIQPQWYGGDTMTHDGTAVVSGEDVVLAPFAPATASLSGDSHTLTLRGSGWSGAGAVSRDVSLRTTVADSGDAYRLSVVNDDGAEVAYIGETGDMAIAGRLYPSENGTLQTSKYITYDGSSGPGGDTMRTNASGWASAAHDFAEMFPTQDLLAAGEVVIFAQSKESVQRSTSTTYDDMIAGVVSTQPGFLAGERSQSSVPVALAGRVPTYVSAENGAIAIGDPLTTSSKPGYAMKATEAGQILGYAMEPFSGNTGVAVAFIRPSYYDGGTVAEAPIAENTVSQVSALATLDVSGSLNMNGGSILSVATLSGIGNNWRLHENGDIVTKGSMIALVRSYGGDDVETYAVLSREHTIELSGTAMLARGTAHVTFEDIDPLFNDVIANTVPYRVIVTPSGLTGTVYVSQRDQEGFVIRDTAATHGVAVDWLVIAYHKDFAPALVTPDVVADSVVEDNIADEPSVGEEGAVEDIPAEQSVDVLAEDAVEDAEDTSIDSTEDPVVPVDGEGQNVPVVEEGTTAEAVGDEEAIEQTVTEAVPSSS